MTARTNRPSTRLVRRSRYLVALVLVVIAFGAYLLLRERPGGTGLAADTCAAMPPELSSELGAAEDCGLFHRNLTQALATAEGGAITRWIGTKSGTSGTIKLGATEMRGATACRRAEITLTRAGAPKRAEIVACLKEGRWQLQS
ncbi:MAG: hypothetical protein ACREIP_14380 [Alphaproteobacteria bacterium]